MIQRIKNAVGLARNMGFRYIGFRAKFELLRKSGLLKKHFPVNVPEKTWTSLERWRSNKGRFFFNRDTLHIPKNPNPELKKRFDLFQDGKLWYFNSVLLKIGKDYDWITNPDNGFQYDLSKHWTEIQDFSEKSGDIKFVWEKSRFSFIYDIIRYDYHFEKDCSQIVFDEIASWINNNPLNCGPNYRCSQEISLRLLNWIFALYYYEGAAVLTEELFQKIQHAIYWQLHHVYHNIDFSRIAVRNNHALTETLTLYLASLIFPDQSDFKKWGEKGKKWFEEEIAYQIYNDGTFLQFSMNYHRVAAQLMTIAIRLSELNHQKLSPVVYERARASLKFLRVCMDDHSGMLPNYGANDGALFFKWNDELYRDFRPQLQALAGVLGINADIPQSFEDTLWVGGKKPERQLQLTKISYSFPDGGYYVFREKDTLTFIRCGSHKDRPSQADNLHLDIWYKGENILQDAGSYKYNTDADLLKYFMGTESHNTVMIDEFDQMKKGSRFIWYEWSQCLFAAIEEKEQTVSFTGTISAFRHLNKQMTHTRYIEKKKGELQWTVRDVVQHLPEGLTLRQLWHTPAQMKTNIQITAETSIPLKPKEKAAWFSGQYGQKIPEQQIEFETTAPQLTAVIKILK